MAERAGPVEEIFCKNLFYSRLGVMLPSRVLRCQTLNMDNTLQPANEQAPLLQEKVLCTHAGDSDQQEKRVPEKDILGQLCTALSSCQT